MKILIINRQYHGGGTLSVPKSHAQRGGGAEAAVRGLTEMLKAQRHEVTVLSLKKKETAPFGTVPTSTNAMQSSGFSPNKHNITLKNTVKTIDDPEVKTVEVRGFAPPDSWVRNQSPHYATPTAAASYQVKRILSFIIDCINIVTPIKVFLFIKHGAFDAVHTHNLRGMGMLTPLAIRIARWAPPPYLSWASTGRPSASRPLFRGRITMKWYHTLHDIQLVYPSGVVLYPALESKSDGRRKTMPWHFRVYAAIQKLIWGSPDTVIAPSEFLNKFYQERGFFKKSSWEVVPNIVPHEKSLRDSHVPTVVGTQNDKAEEASERKSILFVGALEKSKGVGILIEAIRQAGAKAQVDVVGEGSLKGELERERLPHAALHGALPSKKIGELFSRARVTVVPSLTYENAPMIILESLRYGVPVIASRIGGIPEYVDEDITGWLVEPGSVYGLRHRLESVVSEGVSEMMRRNCQRKAVEVGVMAFAEHVKLYR